MKNREEIIWDLVSIENDVARLAVILEEQPLHRAETIGALLHEIESTAAECRKRLVATEFRKYETSAADTRAVVTHKEVRELLEAFA